MNNFERPTSYPFAHELGIDDSVVLPCLPGAEAYTAAPLDYHYREEIRSAQVDLMLALGGHIRERGEQLGKSEFLIDEVETYYMQMVHRLHEESRTGLEDVPKKIQPVTYNTHCLFEKGMEGRADPLERLTLMSELGMSKINMAEMMVAWGNRLEHLRDMREKSVEALLRRGGKINTEYQPRYIRRQFRMDDETGEYSIPMSRKRLIGTINEIDGSITSVVERSCFVYYGSYENGTSAIDEIARAASSGQNPGNGLKARDYYKIDGRLSRDVETALQNNMFEVAVPVMVTTYAKNETPSESS